MRLATEQVEVLLAATRHCFGDTAQIWLFGSRVDDNKKGGDIDLYIETDLTENIIKAKLKMRREIWDAFGDQKIDILVRCRVDEMTPMQVIAKEQAILLSAN